MLPTNNNATYTSLIKNNNTSATYTSLIKNNNGATYMLPTNTDTTFMLPFNTKPTNDICASLLIPSLIYKSLIRLTNSLGLAEGLGLTVTNSLGFGPTNSLGYIAESLIFFLLLYNQVEGTSFQSISLTNLNLSTIKLTFMSNPNFPIRPMNNPRTPQGSTAQERAQQFGPLPVGFTETYTQPTQGRTRSFTTPQTPVFFPPPNSTPGSSYTSDGVVYNTHATKKIKSGSGIRYTKTFRANLADKAKLEFMK